MVVMSFGIDINMLNEHSLGSNGSNHAFKNKWLII